MKSRIFLRRVLSLIRRIITHVASTMRILFYRAAFPAIDLPFSVVVERGATLSATDGGTIKFGEGCFIGSAAQIVSGGGRIVIGEKVHIGSGSIIVSQDSIEIGRDTQIAQYVVIRDQDHDFSSRPIRTSGFRRGAIAIGEDCWLGCKSTVLRNSTIGEGAVIGAHTLVRGNVPAFSLAVGCPHKIVRKLLTE